MKKLAICVFVGCLFASLSIFAQSPQTFTGEIMDSQCAALGGHQIMMKQGESAKDCTDPLRQNGREVRALRSRDQDRLSTRRSEEDCGVRRRRR